MKVHEFDSGALTGRERGEALGRRFAAEIACAATAYTEFFRDLGIADATVAHTVAGCDAALREWAPHLSAEIDAVAAGAGMPSRSVLLLNSRTEVLAAELLPMSECSTLVRVPPTRPGLDAPVLSTQTWDWAPRLTPDGVMWRYATDAGGRVVTFVEPGMLAKIGVNDRGLGVHFNFLDHITDTIDGGVPLHAIVRRILDEASSVDEAIELARSARVGASSVITVVATGPGQCAAAAIEISPAGVAAVRPDDDGWLPHTNHFLDPGLAAGEVSEATSTTRGRLAHLHSVMANDPSGDLARAVLPDLARRLCGAGGSAAPICVVEDPTRPPTEQWRTLLTIRLDPQAGVIHYAEGSPAETGAPGHLPRVF